MAFPRKLLNDGEEIVLDLRPHWLFMALSSAAFIGLIVVGMLILAAALHASSLPLLILGALVAGAGQGMSFGRGLAAVAERTPPDRRAEVSSTYFVVAYVAISLPVIGEGLAAQRWGLQTSGITFAIIVAAIAALCFVAVLVEERRT